MKTQEEIEQLAKQSAQEKYRLQRIPLEQIDEYGGEIATYVSVFINAYSQCQEDMADEIKKAYKQGLKDGYACMPSINSLNKQD